MGIAENIEQIRNKIPASVRLVAVSKTKPLQDIMEAYHAGQKVFGENKAQDLISKQAELPSDIEWHYIGHLQTNKVKYLVPFISMIEAVDSLKLLKEINKQAAKIDKKINCLLQFHIASEDTKFGLDLAEAEKMLHSEAFLSLQHVQICGVMGMATYTDDEAILRKEFGQLRDYFKALKEKYFEEDEQFKEISMGMSGDYAVAIEDGSTNVRIGTAIFGTRNIA